MTRRKVSCSRSSARAGRLAGAEEPRSRSATAR
jgi:hypothetical protein